MKARASLCAAACLALMPSISHALLESCNVSATSLAFGFYDPLNAAPDLSTGTVTVSCTVTLIAVLVSWDVLLSRGSSATFNPRSMRAGGNTLLYNIYTSATYATIWGDGSGGTGVRSSGSLLLLVGVSSFNYTMYGRIPAAQDRPAGAYTDSIVVTLNY